MRSLLVVVVVTGAVGSCQLEHPQPPYIDPYAGSGGFPGRGGAGGSGGVGGFPFDAGLGPGPGVFNQPSFGQAVSSPKPPRPLSGGTLLVLNDGQMALAADPDRAVVSVVDLQKLEALGDVALQPGDEPGRLVEDSAGRVHVVLRGAGAIAQVDPRTRTVLGRRAVCAAPRGIAHDGAQNLLHVACATGELVTLSPEGGAPVRSLDLGLDLRDVVVAGPNLLVTRFRTAEVLTIDPQGAVAARTTPAAAGRRGRPSRMSAAVAWRAVPLSETGGALVLHQRGVDDEVGGTQGGYGGTCDPVVESTISSFVDGKAPGASIGLPRAVVALDLAVAPGGRMVAVAAPGNARVRNLPTAFVARLSRVLQTAPAAPPPGQTPPPRTTPSIDATFASSAGPFGCGGAGGSVGRTDGGVGGGGGATPEVIEDAVAEGSFTVTGEAVSIAFWGKDRVVVQTRNPATLQLLPTTSYVNKEGDLLVRAARTIPLGPLDPGAEDTGHAVFHANAGGLIACASCHPEGGDDARVWKFERIGPRRTQSLRGGISTTIPFHWNGDMRDMTHIAQEVFSTRMSGPRLTPDHARALERWVDTIPSLPTATAASKDAVSRGRELFASPETLCSTCHGGPLFTNNSGANVGSGGTFQTPSLRGVRWRSPFMHSGCAPTLRDRFVVGCGGDQHGKTSHLSASQLDDLTTYLESL